MTVTMRFRNFLLLFVILAPASLPQTPAPATPPANPTIRVSVSLAQVDAVVTDSKGRHISGLTADDFELREDGKPRSITHFSYIDNKPSIAAASAPHKSETTGAPAQKLRREDIHRTMVLVLDDFYTSPAHIAGLRPVAKKFVESQVSPGDLVSVTAVGGGMGIYEQFTSDRRLLAAAVNSLTGRAGQDAGEVFDNRSPRPCQSYIDCEVPDCPSALRLFQTVMGKLSWEIESLRTLPGRKAVVLLSDGLNLHRDRCTLSSLKMEDTMEQVADQANRSGVVIHVLDSRGLTISADNFAVDETSEFLAGETGGLFFHERNDLSDALGNALDDMNGYYLIGFQPARNELERKNGQTIYPKVELKLHRRDLSIRYGKSFSGTLGEDLSAAAGPEAALRKALFSPFDFGGMKVTLTPVYSASPVDPATHQRQSLLQAWLAIDGAGLGAKQTPDGKQAVMQIVVAAYLADNKSISSDAHQFTVPLASDKTQKKLAAGVTYHTDIKLPKPGAYQIRVAVQDNVTGTVGSADSFVEVPDFNKPQLSLSSLVLWDGGVADVFARATVREFHPGARVLYGCTAYGMKPGQPADKSTLDTEIRLFRDGVPVLTGDPMPASPANGSSDTEITGALNLPATLPEGYYQVELVVRDRSADPKHQPTSQWSDLKIVQ